MSLISGPKRSQRLGIIYICTLGIVWASWVCISESHRCCFAQLKAQESFCRPRLVPLPTSAEATGSRSSLTAPISRHPLPQLNYGKLGKSETNSLARQLPPPHLTGPGSTPLPIRLETGPTNITQAVRFSHWADIYLFN